ncbi:MAG: hypothetical protein M0Z95_18010 [Actinomycetota bacterium]|jgi:hypothetical protein|nr:hypothetical protein [Actinomycetota bacterium]
MTRSTWARRCGVAAAVAAVALVAAACSSQPSASRSTKAQAKAHEVTFPAPYGVVSPVDKYGPNWAPFVAAFPLSNQPVNFTGATTNGGKTYGEVPCTQAQAEPSYDATNGHGYNGSMPLPPSFVVRIWKCPSAQRAQAFIVSEGTGGVHVAVDGHPGLQFTGTATRPGRPSFANVERVFQMGRIVWAISADAVNPVVARVFVDSFSLHTAGYQPAKVVPPSG